MTEDEFFDIPNGEIVAEMSLEMSNRVAGPYDMNVIERENLVPSKIIPVCNTFIISNDEKMSKENVSVVEKNPNEKEAKPNTPEKDSKDKSDEKDTKSKDQKKNKNASKSDSDSDNGATESLIFGSVVAAIIMAMI